MSEELIIKKTILKNSVELLNQFFQILGGFNPAVIDIKINPKERIDLDNVVANYSEEFYNIEVVKVENIEKRLIENFNWLKAHVIQYGDADFLRKSHSSYNKVCFEKLLETIRLQIQNYSKDWGNDIVEVLADSKDGTYYRDLLRHGENKSLVIYFANVIH